MIFRVLPAVSRVFCSENLIGEERDDRIARGRDAMAGGTSGIGVRRMLMTPPLQWDGCATASGSSCRGDTGCPALVAFSVVSVQSAGTLRI